MTNTTAAAASVQRSAAARERARERAEWAKTIAGGDDDIGHPRAQAALHQQAQFWTDLGRLFVSMGAGDAAGKVCDDIADQCTDAVDVCEESMHEPLSE